VVLGQKLTLNHLSLMNEVEETYRREREIIEIIL